VVTTSSNVTATVDAAVHPELPPLHNELPDTEDQGKNALGEPEAMGTAIVPLELTVTLVQVYNSVSRVPDV
jgi:hypothetical protein